MTTEHISKVEIPPEKCCKVAKKGLISLLLQFEILPYLFAFVFQPMSHLFSVCRVTVLLSTRSLGDSLLSLWSPLGGVPVFPTGGSLLRSQSHS